MRKSTVLPLLLVAALGAQAHAEDVPSAQSSAAGQEHDANVVQPYPNTGAGSRVNGMNPNGPYEVQGETKDQLPAQSPQTQLPQQPKVYPTPNPTQYPTPVPTVTPTVNQMTNSNQPNSNQTNSNPPISNQPTGSQSGSTQPTATPLPTSTPTPIPTPEVIYPEPTATSAPSGPKSSEQRAYESAMQTRWKAAADEIALLRARGESLQGKKGKAFRESLRTASGNRSIARTKLNQLVRASSADHDKLKSGVERAFADLDNSVAKVRSYFAQSPSP